MEHTADLKLEICVGSSLSLSPLLLLPVVHFISVYKKQWEGGATGGQGRGRVLHATTLSHSAPLSPPSGPVDEGLPKVDPRCGAINPPWSSS